LRVNGERLVQIARGVAGQPLGTETLPSQCQTAAYCHTGCFVYQSAVPLLPGLRILLTYN